MGTQLEAKGSMSCSTLQTRVTVGTVQSDGSRADRCLEFNARSLVVSHSLGAPSAATPPRTDAICHCLLFLHAAEVALHAGRGAYQVVPLRGMNVGSKVLRSMTGKQSWVESEGLQLVLVTVGVPQAAGNGKIGLCFRCASPVSPRCSRTVC